VPDVPEPSAALRSRPPPAASPQAMVDRLELAAIALDRTRMPMVVTDPRLPDNPIVLANQAFLNLTGYAADEILGRNCRFLQGEDACPATVAELRSAIAEARDCTIEILNHRKNGSPFWNRLFVSPIHDDVGTLLYFFASQDDVTQNRKAQDLEAAERQLVKEVDHRARNVLAVVNGIVRLSRSDDPALYAAAIQQRVQTLVDAHTLLADRGWREVSLEQIVRQRLDLVGTGRITVDGPEVMVSAFVVQPLALAIHELLVNATVHGALASPKGTLAVSWVGLAPYGGFELRWEETNGPAPTPAHRSGFGTAMISRMIEKQLDGHVRRNWTETGLIVAITIPKAREAAESAAPERGEPRP
jgi:PAS domain S-box-containing protein